MSEIKNVPGPDEVSSDDRSAIEEGKQWGQYAENDAERKDNLQGHVHNIAVGGLYFGAFLALALVAILTWHVVGPECFKWMSDESVETLTAVLGGAGFAAFINVIRGHVAPPNDDSAD